MWSTVISSPKPCNTSRRCTRRWPLDSQRGKPEGNCSCSHGCTRVGTWWPWWLADAWRAVGVLWLVSASGALVGLELYVRGRDWCVRGGRTQDTASFESLVMASSSVQFESVGGQEAELNLTTEPQLGSNQLSSSSVLAAAAASCRQRRLQLPRLLRPQPQVQHQAATGCWGRWLADRHRERQGGAKAGGGRQGQLTQEVCVPGIVQGPAAAWGQGVLGLGFKRSASPAQSRDQLQQGAPRTRA